LSSYEESDYGMKVGVVLLSGGMDSATVAYWMRRHYDMLYAMTFRYGQKHQKEIECAKKIAELLGIKHIIVDVSFDWLYSALTSNIEIPTEVPKEGEIPVTYVPLRNTVMISIAASFLESEMLKMIEKGENVEFGSVIIASNCVDYSNYPDDTPLYINVMERAIQSGSKLGNKLKIDAPILHFSKADIVRLGMHLGVPYQYTWSCYRGGDKACGKCPSCLLRLRGFKEAGVKDPIEYEQE
jgi:7-cyano-7-deazaguanine synthase